MNNITYDLTVQFIQYMKSHSLASFIWFSFINIFLTKNYFY
jgi:hypothetical protein